ncbi:tRNA-splicing endonuclease subunit Sen54-like isoform X1 [Tripterygium wilfordii]|uniref:tRNA-splicing endonuclease subunit Sen54-like isoform X1 n=1 Tax=Tripterygium wilfordii TaxID=458696 RepID=A0A7J7DVP8_TRIWF|nr:uncharacterized protein LOC119993666 [Tripterygium wilfordii]XP_038696810.1 uncharacterized protein LOC119993666 [Tripterygium wilfordii]KAF5750234.1 tRNA-splicing endonuclease subunit Sen54-like isoform X1 [Tripterygium wilfordii]
MEAQDHWERSSGEEISDGEVNFRDTNDVCDDDDLYYTSGSGCPSKLQFRRDVSKARWNQKMRVAEVLEKKGKMWTTTGIVRGGRTYCFLEETLFLAEIGAMRLVDDSDTCLTLKDIYEKVAEGNIGCCYDFFQVYKQLKSLGYIVGRHGVPWTFRSSKSTSASHSLKEEDSIVELFSNMRVNESLRPSFDVYHPNSRFRKSAPGDPSFVLCLASGSPPSKAEIQVLEKQCNGIPLKFCDIEHGRISFFSFDEVELPVLP